MQPSGSSPAIPGESPCRLSHAPPPASHAASRRLSLPGAEGCAITDRKPLQRIAFQLRLRAGKEAEYDEAHRHVWPELLQELTAAGVREYSIFRRGQQLFLYLLVPSFPDLLAHMAASAVDQRWQATMAPLFEPVPSLQPGEGFAMMQEVFYMEGDKPASSSSATAPAE